MTFGKAPGFLGSSPSEIEIYFQLGYTAARLWRSLSRHRRPELVWIQTVMLNSFIIVLREGFESFLLVAVILSYLRKSGQKWLTSAVYVAIGLALTVSLGLAYLLNKGVEDLG